MEHPSEKHAREVCSDLPGSAESFPFGEGTSVFKAANGKVFAIFASIDRPDRLVTAKAEPEDVIALRHEFPSIRPGYHMDKRHWISVPLDGSIADSLLLEILTESHRLVRPRY